MLQVLEEMWKGKTPALIIKEKDLELIQDQNELERICQTVMAGHPKEVILITTSENGEQEALTLQPMEIRDLNCSLSFWIAFSFGTSLEKMEEIAL